MGPPHTTLLAGRTEERGTLLVRPEAERARRLYAELGYRRLSALRPGEGRWP